MSVASALDLVVEGAAVLNDSNRLVVRISPCDLVARVTPITHHAGHHASADRELELVRHLVQVGSPVAGLDPRVEPRVFVHDGFRVTLWTSFDQVRRTIPPVEYAQALQHLHAGLRQIDVPTPHVVDRVAAVQHDVERRDITPRLPEADRTLLAETMRDVGRSIAGRTSDQLLHGEPHPWNVLDTDDGLLFIDFENTALGPVEYDLAWTPRLVSERHPDADQDLVEDCRRLVLAVVAAYRWRQDDEHPSGTASGVAFLDALRQGPPWPACDEVTW
jgi:aminoglycoside phosphotransferase (APT) family kinase protein